MSGTEKHSFSQDEWLRYTRHIQLDKVGAKGQSLLAEARVLIVGAGGLGSPVSLYLAAAGVGELILVDHDRVDVTNLQRQILFTSDNVGQSKSLCGKQRLNALNPHVNIQAIDAPFASENASALVADADIVLDCTDNAATRYLINDTCVLHKKPWIYGGIHQFSGQCALFMPGQACYRCLFPSVDEQAQDCNTAGVLGVLPGLLGVIQANEAIKYLCKLPTPMANTLLLADAMNLEFRKIALTKNPSCECGKINPQFQQVQAEACEVSEPMANEIEVSGTLVATDYELLDVRSEEEHLAFNLGGKNIPLDQLAQRHGEIDRASKLLLYCQTGKRSQMACDQLQQLGFNACNLRGGIVVYLKNNAM